MAGVDVSNSCPIFQVLMSNRATAADSSVFVFGVMFVSPYNATIQPKMLVQQECHGRMTIMPSGPDDHEVGRKLRICLTA